VLRASLSVALITIVVVLSSLLRYRSPPYVTTSDMPDWKRIFHYWILPPVQIAIFVIATGIVYNISVPTLVYYHVLHVFNPQWGTSTLSERLLESGNMICFAPYFLPTRVWKYFNPGPCSHHRCNLRRYISPAPPPTPWYTYVYRSMGRFLRKTKPRRRPQQDLDASLFLRLPVEIRNVIYVYASGARHEVRYQDPWRFKDYDSGQDILCYHNTRNWEDATSYQLEDEGIIAYHGHPPQTNLLLVCRQVHNEAREQFLSTAAFEVQPLTPSHESWNSEYHPHKYSKSSYNALADSVYAPFIRKVRVRIDMSRFIQGRQMIPSARLLYADYKHTVSTFDEIGFEVCAEMVALKARELCDALMTCAPELRVVEIDWVDDFPEALGERESNQRAGVLLPFTKFEGVRVRVRRLVMSEKGRRQVLKMFNITLRTP
jgi:hypothetical protein